MFFTKMLSLIAVFSLGVSGVAWSRPAVDSNLAAVRRAEGFISLIDAAELSEEPVRIGTHLKDLRQLDILSDMPINVIELKPDKFSFEEAPYYWDGDNGQFVENENTLNLLKEFCESKKAVVQLHFPRRIHLTNGKKRNWSIANASDAAIISAYFDFVSEVIVKYRLAPVLRVTVHPPYEFLRYGFNEIKSELGQPDIASHNEIPQGDKRQVEIRCLRAANETLIMLGRQIEAKELPVVIGVENQASTSSDSWNLGCSVEDFKILLADTPGSIQLTFDTGHRQLSPENLTFIKFAALAKEFGKRLITIHFHTNIGWADDPERTTYRADTHTPATRDNLEGYRYYIRRAAVEKVPLILELDIEKLEEARQLRPYLEGLARDIGESSKETESVGHSAGQDNFRELMRSL